MNRNIWIAIGIVAILLVAGFAAVSLMGGGISSNPVAVKEKGSDTMLELMQKEAEEFNTNQSAVSVEISGGGSGVGITALINGQVDVAQASRAMTPAEIENATSKNGVAPTEFKVAIDGISIIVNSANNVTNLTMEQLRGIYNGTYTNWNQLGGPDLAITAFGRQSTSGTYQYFQEVVMKKENFTASVTQETGNPAIMTKVQQTAGGIGYVGIGYAKEATNAKIVWLKANSTATSYSPLDSNAIYNGSYPLARYLYLYSTLAPTDGVKDWFSFVLSNQGQTIAEQAGFYKLPSDVLSAQQAKLG